jgi:hemerythrin-like domain-containing protein
MKATQLLQKQHREVESIFKAIKSGKGEPMVLLEKLADALVAHMAIEQQLFYPAVKKVDEDLIFESFEEHAVAEVALKRALGCDPMDPTFKAKVTVLEELIQHHVGEEEKSLFPKVEKALGTAALERLGAQMETMFAEAMEEGYEATLTKVIPKTSVDEDVNMLTPNFSGRPSAPSFA